MIRVLVAERAGRRRPSWRRLLRRHPGIRVVATARNGGEVIAAATALRPSLLLLDASVAPHGVPLLVRVVRQRCRDTRVLVLMRDASEDIALAVLGGGAHGYLDTRVAARVLAKAVQCVSAGEPWVPRRIVARVIDRLRLTDIASA